MGAFQRKLREARLRKELTQLQVAEHLMIDRTTYNKYERGTVQPNLQALYVLTQVLGISADELIKPD